MYFIKPLYHTFLCYENVLSENNPEAIKCIDNNRVYDDQDNADFIALLFDKEPRRINIPAEIFLTVADIEGSVISGMIWAKQFPPHAVKTKLVKIEVDKFKQSFTWSWRNGEQEVKHPLNQHDLIWLCEYLSKRSKDEMNNEDRSNDEMKKDNVKIGMSVLHENNYSVPVDADNVDALLDEIIDDAVSIHGFIDRSTGESSIRADFILTGKNMFDCDAPFKSFMEKRNYHETCIPVGIIQKIYVDQASFISMAAKKIRDTIRNDIKEHASIYFSHYEYNEIDDSGYSATLMTYTHTPYRKYSFTILDTSKLKEYFGVEG